MPLPSRPFSPRSGDRLACPLPQAWPGNLLVLPSISKETLGSTFSAREKLRSSDRRLSSSPQIHPERIAILPIFRFSKAGHSPRWDIDVRAPQGIIVTRVRRCEHNFFRLGSAMRRTFLLPLLGLLFGVALAVSAPATFAQTCSSKPLLQGHVCTKPGARCSPPTVGGGAVGVCTIEGSRPEALSCECQGSPIPSYNLTLSLMTPSDLDTGTATSTVTITPFNGYTGTVNFTCSVSGMTQPAPSCAPPAPATVTGEGSATSLLAVTASSSTAQGTYTVTVSAVDTKGRPPDNGTQSSTMSVTRVRWTIGKSFLAGGIALLAFLALLTIWGLSQRNKRAPSE